ncbi:hypothetical protein SAMD00019534_087370 [Acytostelium subglobosum LB1]|uniref:hypothetical protein n=1 Tax=Acytostelium subglobosum LB1 TaxID=1410327 RepID=UPI000644813E|nr:hypothetical protein SAMD00019534_087370 [Acytostelium subglobosum LB1]GAM25562.1 hypothetical protein SAMD00019534_087370 [Acytostelium subglobosum LB1]|eukprot:XP_012751548.1 hypothetical protein SAMD00019534_087370 [Acytostelium subglobosum LB1]
MSATGGGGLPHSTSADNVHSLHSSSKRDPFQAMKSVGNASSHGLAHSLSNPGGHLLGQTQVTPEQNVPEIKVSRTSHDFKPYRSSSPCTYCGESIGWKPFANSFKCSQCGIVCHKKCLDLMSTMSCSNNSVNKVKRPKSTNTSPPMAPTNPPTSPTLSAVPTMSGASQIPSPSLSVSSTTPSTPVSGEIEPGGSPSLASMPADDKLIDSMFNALVKERGLPLSGLKMTKENKWILITQHSHLHQDTQAPSTGAPSTSDHSSPEACLSSLIVMLRTKQISWVSNFINMDGINLILQQLLLKKKENREDCVRAIAVLMNSPVGLQAVSSQPLTAKCLAMVINAPQQFNLKARASAIELLTVMCIDKWVPGGYSMVLKALTKKKEKKRFAVFVKFIRENSSLEMKTKVLCFINVLIHEPEETGVRVNIRSEFLRLGLWEHLSTLKKELAPEDLLLTQIEIFEEMMEEDNQEMEQKLEELKRRLGVDTDNIDAVFKALKSASSKLGLQKSFLSILQNLLVIQSESSTDGVKYWVLCDTLVRQVSMHKSGNVGDANSIDFKSLLEKVDTKEIILQRKLGELEKQNIEKAALLQEKDINIKQLLDLVKQIKESGGEISPELKKQIDDAIKVLEAPPPKLAEIPTTLPPVPEVADGATVSGGPPPPPMMGGPPPPPPPPPPGPGKKNPAAIKTRPPPKVPKPSHPLKALQWGKMPAQKVNESVFNILGEMNDIDLPWHEIETEFAAKVIVRKEKVVKPRGPMQVVDAKLGQNISIFLSQFKGVSNRDLVTAVLNQDETKISRDQVRQMAKLLPSKDDQNALKDFLATQERSKLALADQYCIDIGAFPFAAEKIALFQLRSEFSMRVAELRPDIAAVNLACNDILKSQNIKRLFEIVLVLGNFINYGTVRGEQSGYKIDTLIKMADTKSSDLQTNLTHTLVRYCEQREKKLLTFADELSSLSTAKRVIWSGVVADLAALSRDFSACKAIVEQFQKTNEPFCQTMLSFLELAANEVDKLKKLQANTEESFKKLCTYLGEESSKTTPDEVFELFSRFVELFEGATKFLEQIKEQEEKEAKREAQKQLRAEIQKKKQLTPATGVAGNKKKEDQDDDIVNDLLVAVRDGDVFRKGRRKGALQRVDTVQLSTFSPIVNSSPPTTKK